MRSLLGTLFTAILFAFGNVHDVHAGDKKGTAEEAVAMVKKGIAFVKANGKEKAFAEFNDKNGKFVDGDLYLAAYDLNGKILAHGANLKLIGQERIDITDVDGKYYIKERLEIAKTKGSGWQDYKFPNPVTKEIEKKSMYIERFGDIIIGCGIYKGK